MASACSCHYALADFADNSREGLIIKKLLILIVLLPLTGLYAVEHVYETSVTFHGFSWGTSIEEFVRNAGNPVSQEEANGLVSLLWENIEVHGHITYMLALFSPAGLQGGTYFFIHDTLDELARSYETLRQELLDRFGPTGFFYDGIIRELRPYDCLWNLTGGVVHLKVNTRSGDPMTLWFSSPELTRLITGNS